MRCQQKTMTTRLLQFFLPHPGKNYLITSIRLPTWLNFFYWEWRLYLFNHLKLFSCHLNVLGFKKFDNRTAGSVGVDKFCC